MPNYGFRYDAARASYEIDERTMPVVRRIFDLIVEGASVNGAKKKLEAEGDQRLESAGTRAAASRVEPRAEGAPA